MNYPVTRTISGVLRASTAIEATDIPLLCTLTVDPRDPVALRLSFHMNDYPAAAAPWVIDRSVLALCLTTGSSNPDAVADVFMWLEGDQLVMALSGEEAEACISLPAEAVFEFRSAADRAVPDEVPTGAIETFLTGVLMRPVTIEERP